MNAQFHKTSAKRTLFYQGGIMLSNQNSSSNLTITGSLDVEIISAAEGRITLKLINAPVSPTDSVRFLLKDTDTRTILYPEISSLSSDTYLLDFTALQEFYEYRYTKTFRLLAEMTTTSKISYYRLHEISGFTSAPAPHIFIEDIYLKDDVKVPPTERIVELGLNPEAVSDQSLTITLHSRNHHVQLSHRCELKGLNMRGGILRITFDLNPGSLKYQKSILRFRNKLLEDAISYDFKTVRIKENGELLRIKITLDLHTIDWNGLYWDVMIQLFDSDTERTSLIQILIPPRRRMFMKFLYNGSFRTPDDFYVYPYYTGGAKLALINRAREQYDGFDIVLKEFTAMFLYNIAKPYWKKKHICLVDEKYSTRAQDNGYYFFKHCMEHDEEKYLGQKIYYVITKDSPDYDMIRPYKKNVVHFMTIRHMCYILAAELLVSTDARSHIYAQRSRHSIFTRYTKKLPFVFLQHGVTALKRVDFFYGKGKPGSCDLFVVTSEKEKQIVIDNFDYEPDEVINTGFARWDVLKDKSQNSHDILVMPTWRSWLEGASDREFEESDYFRHYAALLNSQRFKDILEKYDLHANFYLHAIFQAHTESFHIASDRIHLKSFGDTPVNELLMQCKMLITDYSSVCWDVLYQNKPTLFYQFDLDKYNEAHGSYIDMKTDLFGDRTETLDQLLDSLEKTIQNNFHMESKYEKMQQEYFQFKDHEHSRHICEEIKKWMKRK